MPFRTALSGLNAATADLRITGNNIANASTTGFKESRPEFADVFAQSYAGLSKTAIGSGVKLESVTQQFTQGIIDFTGNGMDLALSGRGFFVLDDGGARSYTRAGSFKVDRDGFVVSNSGARVQSYPPGGAGGTFNTGSLTDLQLSSTEATPAATTAVTTEMNLRSDAPDLSAVPFDLNDPTTYSYTTSLSVFDSLGESHVATLYFRNVGQLQWQSNLAIDGTQVGAAQAMTFDPSGALVAPVTAASFGPYVPTTGAAPIDFTVDFSAATQYGSTNGVTALRQDGYPSGRLTGIDIDNSGVVFARFTNGQSVGLGQVAVANFSNPQGLQQAGDNQWVETFAAGDPLFGTAGSGDLGVMQAGGLEASNVDIAAQLVRLITAQRNFQANAQVISTADSITQTIINMR